MHDRPLREMRDRIRKCQYVMTLHADEEMNDDDLSISDIEQVILTGTIIERQKDQSTSERKYVVSGRSIRGHQVRVVTKFSTTGLLVIITVFRE